MLYNINKANQTNQNTKHVFKLFTIALLFLSCSLLGQANENICNKHSIENPSSCAKSTIHELTQKNILYDGPNCYNAVLLAKNFMHEITYVDSIEFAFYLENFCQIKKNKIQSENSILVYFGSEPHPFIQEDQDPEILHTALNLGGGLIFEKTSNAGSLFNQIEGLQIPGIYKIKNLENSSYADKSSGTQFIKEYICKSEAYVRDKIVKLNKLPLINKINSLRFNFNSDDSIPTVNQYSKLSREIKQLIFEINKLKGNLSTDKYALAVASSLHGSIGSFVEQDKKFQDDELNKTLHDLLESIFNLKDKINFKLKIQRKH